MVRCVSFPSSARGFALIAEFRAALRELRRLLLFAIAVVVRSSGRRLFFFNSPSGDAARVPAAPPCISSPVDDVREAGEDTFFDS